MGCWKSRLWSAVEKTSSAKRAEPSVGSPDYGQQSREQGSSVSRVGPSVLETTSIQLLEYAIPPLCTPLSQQIWMVISRYYQESYHRSAGVKATRNKILNKIGENDSEKNSGRKKRLKQGAPRLLVIT